MTTQKLLQGLRDRLNHLQGAINEIESYIGNPSLQLKAKQILKAAKPVKIKKHWTQTSEGKKKLSQRMKEFHKSKK